MERASRSASRRLAVGTAVIAMLALTDRAAAETRSARHFSIPQQRLSAALKQYALQADIQIIFSDARGSQVRTPELIGDFTAEEALDRLLSGSQFSYTRLPRGAFRVHPARSPPRPREPLPDTSVPVTPFTAPPAPTVVEAPTNVADVLVTASRIVRDGFAAPTPTTVIDEESFKRVASVHVADYVNQLPQLAGSQIPQRTFTNISSGIGGANILNLRGLGMERTLTLLNGRRVVGAAPTGVVDVNLFPAALVSRVEVVTGGASSAWGSDAVGGVVNFVLDTQFTGLKGSIEAGQTSRGDGRNAKISLALGKRFAGGRGHIVLAAAASTLDEMRFVRTRDWYKAAKFFVNPAWAPGAGQPYFTIATHVGMAAATNYGLITAVSGGASPNLVGTAFNPDGSTYRFEFGTLVSGGALQLGGTYEDSAGDTQLQPGDRQHQLFLQADYRFTDKLRGFLEASYSESVTPWHAGGGAQGGNNPAAVIRQDNAYLPAALRTLMPAGSSITLGRNNTDLFDIHPVSERNTKRVAAQIDADLVDDWTFNGYVQHGRTSVRNNVWGNAIPSRLVLAQDAVVVSSANVGASGLAIGEIACRSTLTNPANGCAPVNPFLYGTASPAAKAYISANGLQTIRVQQTVAAAQVNGTPFSSWAGLVSVVLGVEARRERLKGGADQVSQAGLFRLGNFAPISGRYDVIEAFGEAVVPLVSRRRFAEAVELDLAGRLTRYSVSGAVATWKVGANWVVSDGLRFRGTRSRDIRAPNMQDLFAVRSSRQSTVFDPASNANLSIVTTTSGNLGLKPEKADTWGLGVVLRPSWLRGFSASADYFDIRIEDAIATVAPTTIVSFCNQGNAYYCPSVERNAAGVLTGVSSQPFNANSETERGIDFEFAYKPKPLRRLPGQFSLRLLATRVLERKVYAGGTVNNLLGQSAETSAPGPLPWRGLFSADYALGPARTAITVRYIGPGVIDNNYVEGGDRPLVSVSDNSISSMTSVDLSETLDLSRWTGRDLELFAVIKNLTDAQPPVAVFSGTNAGSPGTNYAVYDMIGRTYRLGLRFKF